MTTTTISRLSVLRTSRGWRLDYTVEHPSSAFTTTKTIPFDEAPDLDVLMEMLVGAFFGETRVEAEP